MKTKKLKLKLAKNLKYLAKVLNVLFGDNWLVAESDGELVIYTGCEITNPDKIIHK